MANVKTTSTKSPAVKKDKAQGEIKVTLIKSTIGCTVPQKATVEALGLKKIGKSKIHKNNPAIQGMIFKVKHLVSVEEVK